jgi:hypothetical protein
MTANLILLNLFHSFNEIVQNHIHILQFLTKGFLKNKFLNKSALIRNIDFIPYFIQILKYMIFDVRKRFQLVKLHMNSIGS